MHRVEGMTLPELMLTLAIVAIAGAVAMPGFADLRRQAVRTAAVNDFLHALYLARSEAIQRMDVVSVCKSTDGRTCSNGLSDWAAGWMVFANRDRDQPPEADPGEPVLRTHPGWPGGRITANRPAFSFRPVTQGAVNGTILFCSVPPGRDARAIIVSATGRPRVTDRAGDGTPLACP